MNVTLKRLLPSLAALALCAGLSACTPKTDKGAKAAPAAAKAELNLDVEHYTLANGLTVVLHVDKSDPVVAINLAAHVGSARETAGRTGFAHLFEHLLFLDSENLGYGGLDEMNTRIGGDGTNGFTTNDMTQYFQAVPSDALEKIIWAEADKLGYFINTVTQDVVDNEKQVVKNEKRQRVDNVPYGHSWYIAGKTLYPESHPYNWQVIGSLADLDAASLKDVQDFYKRWYVPNNVVVTLSGDFDPAEARRLIEKYFGEIPRGEDAKPFPETPATLPETTSLYYEDNFATVPQLAIVWPGTPQYHPDSYALDVLVEYLSSGKEAPLNAVLIDEEKLTSNVSAQNNKSEIAGEIYVIARTEEGKDLDTLLPALDKAFARFEQNGISQADLDRIKAGEEVNFYGSVQSALGKAIALAEYTIFKGDPEFYKQDLAARSKVTTADVMRVYETYLKGKPALYLSVVPKGAQSLKIDDRYPAALASIVEEKIIQGEGDAPEFDPTARSFTPTPSGFDRTVEPGFGKPYALPSPQIFETALDNGVKVYAMTNTETPLVYFSLHIDAGLTRGSVDKPAVPRLVADMLEKGTQSKTTAEFENAVKALGSGLSISVGENGAYVSGQTLARNLGATVALAEEMLLTPRWEAAEFDLLMTKRAAEIDESQGDAGFIARREQAALRYPEDHILRYNSYAPKDRLQAVTLDDLKAFHSAYYVPGNAKLRIVGDITSSDIQTAFAGLTRQWSGAPKPSASWAQPAQVTASKVYFYDVPQSKQSQIRIFRPSLSAKDPNYPLAEAMNFMLGGIYTSRLNTELRVKKGYTYGIGSGFSGDLDRGEFSVRTAVRSNVTLESAKLISDIVGNYGPSFTEEDLATMKDALIRGEALKTETLSDKLSLVSQISTYGYPSDYRAQNAARIKDMTLDQFKAIAAEHLRPDAMNYLVVGDAESQAARLKDLGYGAPVMLSEDK